MSATNLTAHAALRIAQRGIRDDDLQLALAIGTEVEGGILVREKDCQEFVCQLKRLIHQVLRLRGQRIVVAGEQIVTVYRATPRKRRTLLRRSGGVRLSPAVCTRCRMIPDNKGTSWRPLA